MSAALPVSPNSRNELQALRSNLKTQQAVIEASFLQHKNPARLLKNQTQLIDKLLKTVWLQANIHTGCGLIAVGGYGRGELFPYSDIDLLILLPEQLPRRRKPKN